MIDLPATASALLAELRATPDTPEPVAESARWDAASELIVSWPDYATEGDGDGACYDSPPLTDPTQMTPAQIGAMVAALARELAVTMLEQELAARAARDRAVLYRLLASPTDAELPPPPPVKTIPPQGGYGRMDYRGWMP